MEHIQSALQSWLKNNEDFQTSFNEMRKKILSSDRIKAFLKEHPELTEKQIDSQLMKLYEYDYQSIKCEKCASLDSCINVIKGYVPGARVQNGRVKLIYHECQRKERELQLQKQRSFVQSLHMPKEIHDATFSQIKLEANGREEALQKVRQFYEESGDTPPKKGVYLHGSFGVGKTYLLAALANELAKKQIDTLLIYMPEFVREMKASITDSTINQKIDQFKRASVLIFDDIGAEFLSPWFRDEVLGAILQFRMMERLPVFFTSNYDLSELESMLSKAGRGDVEELKAARIMERIRQISEPVEVTGQNHRDQ
ncbi:primosomal protein DnaI [Alkalibacillus filiformis]|uniref:Primosomal protein DnaI n=1 Tax=Alkalibacillus filiformis TaxID=200990 RepID=A0ABU0DSA5_9BACI|nr:primosomal protein DnaI [Alkalibacillus filiformis]MDQ0351219.1 primosomal protein DnaI [Alkalibacillus filiformis]